MNNELEYMYYFIQNKQYYDFMNRVVTRDIREREICDNISMHIIYSYKCKEFETLVEYIIYTRTSIS